MVDFVDFVDLFCMRNFRNLFLIPLHQISALVCTRGVTKRDSIGMSLLMTPLKTPYSKLKMLRMLRMLRNIFSPLSLLFRKFFLILQSITGNMALVKVAGVTYWKI